MHTVTNTSRQEVVLLKGLAILAVVTVHFLANLQPGAYTSAAFSPLIIAIDQLSRFSVPLFVALSGYALSHKYLTSTFSIRSFIRRRLLKLLPLYVLWSGLSFWVLSFSSDWVSGRSTHPFFIQLLRGEADYQLYFIPMVVQLYILFPLLFSVIKKFSVAVLLGAIGLQLLAFWLFRLQLANQIDLPFNPSDQRQYLLSVSWIAYFVLGMVVAHWERRKNWMKIPRVVGAIMLVSFISITTYGIRQIQMGIDPIIALRFTRPIIVLYAGASILFLLSIKKNLVGQGVFSRVLQVLGKYSYLVFLSHTLVLRILFGWIEGSTPIPILLQALAIVIAGWMLSRSLSSET